MTDRRALLTDREREIIADDADVSDSYRYQTISRVRSRLDRLAGDLEALEAHGDLADELRAKVCNGGNEMLAANNLKGDPENTLDDEVGDVGDKDSPKEDDKTVDGESTEESNEPVISKPEITSATGDLDIER